jgi:hypothetical protein
MVRILVSKWKPLRAYDEDWFRQSQLPLCDEDRIPDDIPDHRAVETRGHELAADSADKLREWLHTYGVNYKHKNDPPLERMPFLVLKVYYLWNEYFFNLVRIRKGHGSGQVPLSPYCERDRACLVGVYEGAAGVFGQEKNNNTTALFARRLQPMPVVVPQPACLLGKKHALRPVYDSEGDDEEDDEEEEDDVDDMNRKPAAIDTNQFPSNDDYSSEEDLEDDEAASIAARVSPTQQQEGTVQTQVVFPLKSIEDPVTGSMSEHPQFQNECRKFFKLLVEGNWQSQFQSNSRTTTIRNLGLYLYLRHYAGTGDYYRPPANTKKITGAWSMEERKAAEEWLMNDLGLATFRGGPQYVNDIVVSGNVGRWWKSRSELISDALIDFLNNVCGMHVVPSTAPSATRNRNKKSRSA